MAHSKQALKRHRQSLRRRAANKIRISAMNTEMKRTLGAIGAGDVAAAKEAIRAAMTKIDKAAKKNSIHKNTAARRKSLLARRLAALETK